MSEDYKFEICKYCINRELDPMACDECEDGELFEGYDDDDDVEDVQTLSLDEFKRTYVGDLGEITEDLELEEFRKFYLEREAA